MNSSEYKKSLDYLKTLGKMEAISLIGSGFLALFSPELAMFLAAGTSLGIFVHASLILLSSYKYDLWRD